MVIEYLAAWRWNEGYFIVKEAMVSRGYTGGISFPDERIDEKFLEADESELCLNLVFLSIYIFLQRLRQFSVY